MKTRSLLLSTLLLVTACGGGGSHGPGANKNELGSASPSQLQAQSDAEVRELRKLLVHERPNIALARFVGSALSLEQQALIQDSLVDLDLRGLQVLIDDMVETNRAVRTRYLYHGHAYQNSPAFLYKTASHQSLGNEASFGFKAQLTLGVVSYVRSKALDEILQSYIRRSNELKDELAPQLAVELQKHSPETALEIERLIAARANPELVKEKISQALLKIAPIAEVLGTANLSGEDKAVLLGTGVLAGGLYLVVEKNKEFKNIVAQVRQAQETIQEVQKKYKEFTALTVTLQKHATNSAKHFKSFEENITVAREQIEKLASDTFGSAAGTSGVHSRRIADFVNTQLRGGKPVGASTLPSQYVQTASVINTRLANSVNAIGGMASSLDGIIGTSLQLTNLLGIKLSPGMQKTLKTAQTVASMVSMGSKAFEMFQTGGISAALGVLGGGSPLGDANAARFDRIDAKLDEVLANQKIIINLQRQTMEMIKNVAVMIDEYHEKEMDQLAIIRNYSIINLEISKAGVLHRDIKNCEQMIRYHFSSPWPTNSDNRANYTGWSSIDVLQSQMSASLVGLNGIRRLVTSNGEDHYKNCKQAMTLAFGDEMKRESPLAAIFDSDESAQLLSFSTNVYGPLLSELRRQTNGMELSASALHHPMTNVADLHLKAELLPREGDVAATGTGVYALDELISLKNTERYLSNLLVLYPIFEVEKQVWNRDLPTIVASYLNVQAQGAGTTSSGLYFLSGALKVVQSAIAQEALLAGEPVIPGVYGTYHRRLLSSSSCKGIKGYTMGSDGEDLVCFLRGNTQFMHNYLRYALLQNGVADAAARSFYQEAYEAGNLKKLSEFLRSDLVLELDAEKKPVVKLSAVNHLGILIDKYALPLPTADELVGAKMLYSEKMRTLFDMQDRIITELEKLHPIRRDLDADAMLKMWGIL